MKKNSLFMLSILSVTLSVFSVGSVRRALLFDTRIAYADASIIYIIGRDGSEHAALDNFYPRTHDYANPSEWSAGAGVDWNNVRSQLSLSKRALNACRIVETHCEHEDDSACPFALTGAAIVTPSGQVYQLWSNPF